jgi:anti-sigma factor RsiW
MNDCPNAEMRDLLPDLLHDRLTASVRAEVTAHVAGCTDCREELELIRGLHGVVLLKAPRVDVAFVVNALPKPPQRDVKPIAARRRTWADWRIAAAITLIAAGGSSVALLNRAPTVADSVAVGAVVSQAPVDSQTGSATPAPVTPAPAHTVAQTSAVAQNDEPAELGTGGRLSDLDDAQLKSLIDEIGKMKAVPITEPEPVSMRVDPRNTSGSEDLQ